MNVIYIAESTSCVEGIVWFTYKNNLDVCSGFTWKSAIKIDVLCKNCHHSDLIKMEFIAEKTSSVEDIVWFMIFTRTVIRIWMGLYSGNTFSVEGIVWFMYNNNLIGCTYCSGLKWKSVVKIDVLWKKYPHSKIWMGFI